MHRIELASCTICNICASENPDEVSIISKGPYMHQLFKCPIIFVTNNFLVRVFSSLWTAFLRAGLGRVQARHKNRRLRWLGISK